MDDPHVRRRAELCERLQAAGADACVLFPGRNLQYLTGFDETPGERHLLLVVPVHGEPAMLLPALYDQQVRETTDLDDYRAYADDEDPIPLLQGIAEDRDLSGGRLLVDDTLHARFLLDVREAFDDPEVSLVSEILGPMRCRKDESELDALGRSAAAADAAMETLREMSEGLVGRTERAIAREVRDQLAAAGGEGVSFEVIAGSGPNGAKPHHTHGERVVERGDPVVLDFGTRVDGYVSDTTRTVVPAGDPPERFEVIHDVVREAQQAGVEAVEAGATTGDVDAAAREVIEAAGHGERFLHRTGHGVGLDVHEEPYVMSGGATVLEKGMVFSVEPGVYLPGEFGVRIEDLVAVTANGCERLNTTDRGWR